MEEETARLALGVRDTRVSSRDPARWMRHGRNRFAPGEMVDSRLQMFHLSGRERMELRRHNLPLLESAIEAAAREEENFAGSESEDEIAAADDVRAEGGDGRTPERRAAGSAEPIRTPIAEENFDPVRPIDGNADVSFF